MANYNNGRYIEAAIESVQRQTFADWELVIVDDASDDDSFLRIQTLLTDTRIKLFVRPANGGYTKALMFGLEQVRSALVGILDSDDALIEDAIEKVHALHTREPALGLVLSQVIICDSNLKPLHTTATTQEHLKEPLLWMRGSTAFRTFKMAAYGKTAGLDARLASGEDADLLFKLEEVAPVRRLDEPLYRYRQLRSSKSKAARSYHITYSCIALAIYWAHRRRRRVAAPNLPKQVVEAWLLAAIRYSFELGEPLQAVLFAVRAIRVGRSIDSTRRVFTATARAFELGRRRRSSSRTEAATGVRYLPVREFQSATGNIESDRINCIPSVHRPGHCLFGGDYQVVATGRYRVTFELMARCPSFAREPVLALDVHENVQGRGVLAERRIGRKELTQGLQRFSVNFDALEGDRIEFRVYWAGQCWLSVMGVLFEELGDSSFSGPTDSRAPFLAGGYEAAFGVASDRS